MKPNNHYDFDIISIGDSTLDTFLDVNEAGILYNAVEDISLLCMSYKDIIPADSVDHKVAGNAANNAVGSARLGLKTAFYTEFGEDDTGEKIKRKLEAEKVNCEYVKIKNGTNSNYTVVINYKTERTQLIYRQDRNYQLPNFKKSKYVYLTAMGETKPVFYKTLYKYLVKNNVKLGFNPGESQLRAGIENLRELLKMTTVLFLNKEEARSFFNLKTSRAKDGVTEIKEFLFKAWDYGPSIMVITDGGNGAYAYNGRKYYHIPIRKVKVIERTGAGDAFATAFIAALKHDKPIEEALVWGSLNSANVIQYMGPQDGLLTLNKMKKQIEKLKRYKAVEI